MSPIDDCTNITLSIINHQSLYRCRHQYHHPSSSYASDDHNKYADYKSDDCHDPQEAGNKAADALFKKYSDVAQKCGASSITYEVVPLSLKHGLKMSHGPAIKSTTLKGEKYVPWDLYRQRLSGSTCTGPHEFCCEAPGGDPSNCPNSARTSDCDAKGSCCCA